MNEGTRSGHGNPRGGPRSRRVVDLTAVTLLAIAPWAHAGGLAQGPKLIGSDGVPAPFQGCAVALSADGNTAIVGGSNGVGAAWIFTRAAGVWTQQGMPLVGSGATGLSYQGTSVALSADGNTALLGGPLDNSNAGAAWVFVRSGNAWTQQGGKLVGSPASADAGQGYGVALSADGNTALVGGPNNGSNAGGAWVFTRSGTTWTQQGATALLGTGSVGAAQQGRSVALSADGNTALVGGPADAGFAGAVWVFVRNGSSWSQQGAKLHGSTTALAQQGIAVALSADGDTALVGAPSDGFPAMGVYPGAAFVFTRSGSTWSQQGAKLVGGDAAGQPGLGASVSLASDGSTALVGGPADGSYAGAAFVFGRSGVTWSQQGTKLVAMGSSGGTPEHGYSVALSGDGHTAIVGGPYDHAGVGAGWIYMRVCSRGDASGDGNTNVADVLYLINNLFAGGPPAACY